MGEGRGTVYVGRFVHSKSLNDLELFEKAYLKVNSSGAIVYFGVEPILTDDCAVLRLFICELSYEDLTRSCT